jgi:hypothetical protein
LVTATTTITAGNMCAQGLHSFGQSCDLTGSQAATPAKVVTRYSYALCSVDGSGGGTNPPTDPQTGGGSDGSSTGDGSSTTTNPNQDEEQEVVTTPVTPGLDGEEPVKTPCSELKINSLDTVFKDQMQALKTNINGTNEKTFRIINGSLLTPHRANPYCGQVQTGTAQQSGTIQYVSALKALAHNHLQDAIHNHIGTFTPNDILQLNNIAIMAENNGSLVTKEEFASYLVCKEGNYSIKINDIDKLYNFATKYANDNEFSNVINKYYESNNMLHGKDKQLQNMGFLKLLAKYDLGVDYYETDSNFENWKKLELNEDETDINETPC